MISGWLLPISSENGKAHYVQRIDKHMGESLCGKTVNLQYAKEVEHARHCVICDRKLRECE